MSRRQLRRRDALALLGGTLAAPLLGCGTSGGDGEADAATTCILSPEVTEGPYWIDETLTRRNVTEGRPGTPLILDLTVVDAKTCKAIANADVEIWHSDAAGEYSGFDGATTRTHYLRGHQKSNAEGDLRFVTIFPGWYRGRTPHIHLKVHVGGDVVHTGQLFMSERIAASVYRHAPYKSRGQADTTHAEDGIYAQAGGSKSTLKLRRRANGKPGYVGTITLGVAT
jgi:protocatechuate 3,4-dioxygenase beta subunit